MKKENIDTVELNKIIRSLLLSSKHGLPVNELCSEYYAVTSQVLPYKSLGYNSAIDLFKDMPDVIQPVFVRDYSDGNQTQRLILKGIADEHTVHIRELVSRQKADTPSKLYSPQSLLVNATKRPVSSFIQSKLVALLEEYPSGLEFDNFGDAYLEKYGKQLNPLLLGFTSVKILLESCSNILHWEHKEGNVKIYAKKQGHVETSITRTNISKEMRKDIFCVLMKYNHQGGLYVSQFASEFKDCHRKELDYQTLGYDSLVQLMAKLSGMVDIVRPIEGGDWFVIPKMYVIRNDGMMTRENYQYTTYLPGEIGNQVEIVLTFVINPSFFWFQSTDNSDLMNLMEEMNEFYNSVDVLDEYIMPADSLVTGQPCAAKYSDEQWYRGIIKDGSSPGKVCVFFVDYGDTLLVETSFVCVLRADFISLPLQAIAARLNVRYVRQHWTKEHTETFFHLTENKKLSATIIDTKRIICLELIGPDGNDITDVIKELAIDRTNQMSDNVIINQSFCSVNKKEEPVADSRESEVFNDELIDKGTESDESTLVKCLPITEGFVLHIIHNKGEPIVTSAELSDMFWDGDVVKQMLRRQGVDIEFDQLICDENVDLFSALVKHSVNGVLQGAKARPVISVYKLQSACEVFNVFYSKYPNALQLLQREINNWSSDPFNYWKINSETTVLEEEETSFNKLQSLKNRQKILYQTIMTSKADGKVVEEIKQINDEIGKMGVP